MASRLVEGITLAVIGTVLGGALTYFFTVRSERQASTNQSVIVLKSLTEAVETIKLDTENRNDYATFVADSKRVLAQYDKHAFESAVLPEYLNDEVAGLMSQLRVVGGLSTPTTNLDKLASMTNIEFAIKPVDLHLRLLIGSFK